MALMASSVNGPEELLEWKKGMIVSQENRGLIGAPLARGSINSNIRSDIDDNY